MSNLTRRAGLAICVLLSLTTAAGAHSAERPPRTETAVLAGGCFWGMELVFESLKGVSAVTSGYAGGSRNTAQYEVVSSGTTGHAESVQIVYDPTRITYRQLLSVYFTVAHDPTERDRQGPDSGAQYRSAVFYSSDMQRQLALDTIARLVKARAFAAPIVTEVVPLAGFYAAEAYHQHFAARNPGYPYIVENDTPKVVELRHRFPELVRTASS